MSESPVEAPPSTSFLLDGDVPRLGGTAPTHLPTPPPGIPAMPPPSLPASPSPLLSAPGPAPLLGSTDPSAVPYLRTVEISTPVVPETHTSPSLPTAGTPPRPTGEPVASSPTAATPTPTAPTATDGHAMAHLMPQQSAAGEASRRAAEIRAAKKAKARKIKFGVAIGALVVAVLAGPPVVGWVIDAINEAGTTSDVEE